MPSTQLFRPSKWVCLCTFSLIGERVCADTNEPECGLKVQCFKLEKLQPASSEVLLSLRPLLVEVYGRQMD